MSTLDHLHDLRHREFATFLHSRRTLPPPTRTCHIPPPGTAQQSLPKLPSLSALTTSALSIPPHSALQPLQPHTQSACIYTTAPIQITQYCVTHPVSMPVTSLPSLPAPIRPNPNTLPLPSLATSHSIFPNLSPILPVPIPPIPSPVSAVSTPPHQTPPHQTPPHQTPLHQTLPHQTPPHQPLRTEQSVSAFPKSSIGSGRKRPRDPGSAVSGAKRKRRASIGASPTAVTANVSTSGRKNEDDDSVVTASFDCDLCNTRFFRKHHLERHIQNIHEGHRPWICKECGFAFHQKPNLERHIMTVHEDQKPFRCDVCHMSFGRKGVLKKHKQMVHEHSRKFECDICRIPFGLKSDLKRHVQSVHQKKRPFVCEICPASFGRRSDLKRHTLSLHPGAELPARQKGPQGKAL